MAKPPQPGANAGPSVEEMEQLDQIAKWTLRENALKEQLQRRQSQVDSSRREEKELGESLRLLTEAFEETRGERYDIVSDFTRQYKATLEELIRVVTTTESTIAELRDQQELAKIALLETGKEKEHFLNMKDEEIKQQNKRIAEMDEEFHIMIEEMQRKMDKKVAESVKAARRAAAGGGGGGGGESDDEDETSDTDAEAAAGEGEGSAAAAAGRNSVNANTAAAAAAG